jgi:hypothetical protein
MFTARKEVYVTGTQLAQQWRLKNKSQVVSLKCCRSGNCSVEEDGSWAIANCWMAKV